MLGTPSCPPLQGGAGGCVFWILKSHGRKPVGSDSDFPFMWQTTIVSCLKPSYSPSSCCVFRWSSFHLQYRLSTPGFFTRAKVTPTETSFLCLLPTRFPAACRQAAPRHDRAVACSVRSTDDTLRRADDGTRPAHRRNYLQSHQ